MEQTNYVHALVKEAIHAIETNSLPLSAINQKCIRIARLRNDYINFWWLSIESINPTNEKEKNRVYREFIPHLTKEAFAHFNKKHIEFWMEERRAISISEELEIDTDKDNIVPISIGEIELEIARYEKLENQAQTPQGLHPVDLYHAENAAKRTRFISAAYINHYQAILERIKVRLHDFLSQAEKQLLFGQFHSDIFEENRKYVEIKLGQMCPDALAKFISAYQRMTEDDKESWAQALTSCRRLLKSLSDVLYKPKDTPVVGADGKTRILTDELYIARLWQFVYEQAAHSASGELLQSQVHDIGNRIDRLYELANKGVHAEINRFEVNQCVIQTYIVIGDLLRISERQTAIGVDAI